MTRGSRRARSANVLAATAVLALARCTGTGDDGPTSPSSAASSTSTPDADEAGPVSLGETAEIATGLEAPWSIVFVGETALVSERDSGRILELGDDGSTSTVHTIEDIVRPDSGGGMGPEGGLLGMAVDDEERLYVYSTGAAGNRIQRFDITGDPGSLELGESETILTGPGAGVYHNGGRIAFGPDGMLYAMVGETGQAEASPCGMAVVDGTIVIANLRGEVLRTVPVADPGESAEHFSGEYGRIRDVVVTPDGDLWLLTNNTDGRGEPGDGDDRVVEVEVDR